MFTCSEVYSISIFKTLQIPTLYTNFYVSEWKVCCVKFSAVNTCAYIGEISCTRRNEAFTFYVDVKLQ